MSSGRATSFDWQIECKNNGKRALHMFKNGLYTDCEFLVGLDDEKQNIKAHKIFLAMGSPVFEAMFFGGMAAAQLPGPIEVLDVQPDAFKNLLEYIYSEHIDLNTFDQACELCYAAKKYMLPGLVEQCSLYMWKDLFPENACRALEFANLYEDANLKLRSMDIIRHRTRQSLASTMFEDITESTLLILVKDDELSINEAELFEALKRWASKECERREKESTATNLRQVLTNILSHIRFLTMTTEEFASGPAMSGILHQEESFAILMNLSCPDKWPMPANLSSNRTARNLYASTVSPAYQNQASVSVSGGSVPNQRSIPDVPDPFQARLYCYRRVCGETLVMNMGILDCAVSLSVDRNVCIQGIVIASQVPKIQTDEETESCSTYVELLYCHLLDRDGTRLTYAHFSSRASKRSTLDVLFNRPVYVQRNREYRICVVLNRGGYYPLGNASTSVIAQGVHFRFGPSPSESTDVSTGIRDGFIRGIIFSF